MPLAARYARPAPEPVVDSGRFRHFCAIEKPPASKDGYGQPNSTWVLVTTGYFSIEEVRGREAYQSGQITSQVTHEIVGYWTSVNIDPTMRVVHSLTGQAYKIQSVDNVDLRNTVIKLMCLAINEGTNP